MYILAIITCEKYRKNLSQIRESWLSRINEYPQYKYYFVFGHPEIEQDYIIRGDELWVKASDDYEGLSEKVRKMITSLNTHYSTNQNQLTGIYKIDDDVYVDLQRLSMLIPHSNYEGRRVDISNSNMSNWHFGKCQDQTINNTKYIVPACSYCGGPFYYLSKKVMQLISSIKDPSITIFEDVNMGYLLNKYDIYPKHVLLYADYLNDWQNYNEWKKNKQIPGFHDNVRKMNFKDIHI